MPMLRRARRGSGAMAIGFMPQHEGDPARSGAMAMRLALTGLALALWLPLYRQLQPTADRIVTWLPVGQDGSLAAALRFFLYDTPKVLLLLTLVVFLMGVVRSFFSPERTRRLLAGRREGI